MVRTFRKHGATQLTKKIVDWKAIAFTSKGRPKTKEENYVTARLKGYDNLSLEKAS
jgi:hypothetical protein